MLCDEELSHGSGIGVTRGELFALASQTEHTHYVMYIKGDLIPVEAQLHIYNMNGALTALI